MIIGIVIFTSIFGNSKEAFSAVGGNNPNKVQNYNKTSSIIDNVSKFDLLTSSINKLKLNNDKEILEARLRYKVLKSYEIEEYNHKSNILFKSFSEDVRRSLYEYTQDNTEIIKFISMNSSFGEIRGMKIKDIVANIDDAIGKYLLTEDIVTFRATKKKYYENLKVGDEFKSNVYYSTSLNEEIAKLFLDNDDQDILLKIYVPKNSKVLYIGDSIMSENELLLARDIKYKVISIDGNNMTLEIVDD